MGVITPPTFSRTIFAVPEITPVMLKLIVVPVRRAAVLEKTRLLWPPKTRLDCTVASPAMTVRRPIFWTLVPADLPNVKVPPPSNVSGEPDTRLPLIVSVPALIVVPPV